MYVPRSAAVKVVANLNCPCGAGGRGSPRDEGSNQHSAFLRESTFNSAINPSMQLN